MGLFDDVLPEPTTPQPSSGLFDDVLKSPKKATIAGELWQAAKDLPTHIKGSIGASLEGNQPFAENDYKDRWVQESRDLSKQRMSELPQEELQRNLLPGISVQDFRQLSPSMGFSLAGQAAGLASGLATTAVTKNPISGYVAGGIASGIVAKRSQENAFLRDLRQKADQDAGRPITNEEFAPIATKYAQEAADYGTAEAVPEAIGNVIDLAVLRSPGTGFGKTLITRAFKKLASMYGTEIATEAVTQQFQQRQEAIAGLTPEKKRELTNLSDWWNSTKEVAGPTILQTTLMAGAGKVGSTVYDKATGGAKTIQPTHPEITTETPGLSPEATQPSPIADGLTPETTTQSQDEFAALQQSEGRDAGIQTQADQRKQRNLDSIAQEREVERGVLPDQQVAAAQAASDETQTAMAAAFAKAQLGSGALGRAASAGIDSGAVDPLQVIAPATPVTQDRVATLMNLSERARNVGDEAKARQFEKMAMSEPGKKENLKFIDQIVTNLEKKAGVNNGTTGQQATEIPAQSSQIGGDNLSTGVGNTNLQRISGAAERGVSTATGIAVPSSVQPESVREQIAGNNVNQGEQNAISQQIAESQIPPAGKPGENIAQGGAGVRQGQQGTEAAAKSTEAQAQVAKTAVPLSKVAAERVARQFTAQGMPTFVVPHPVVEGKYAVSNTPETTSEILAAQQSANAVVPTAIQQPNVVPIQAAEPGAEVQQVQNAAQKENAVKQPWQMTVKEFDAATRAEAVKNAPGQPESWYIAQAKRNHDNAMKHAIESGEAGVTPQDSVSATSQTAPAENSQVTQLPLEAKVLGTPISAIADKPLDSMAKSNFPVGEAARKEQSRRKSITPLKDIRLNDEAIRAELQRMPAESGWSEVGGRLIRIPNSEVAGDETISRTKWIPHAEWYGAGLGNREFITTAVDKALAGNPMRAAEKRTVTHMLSYLQDKMYPNLDGYDTNTLDDAGVLDDNEFELSSLDSLLSAYEEKAGVNSEYAQYLTALGNEDIGEPYDTEAEISNSQTEPVAATKPQEGSETSNAVDRGQEGFTLETQSAKDLAAKEAQANDEVAANREIADKERGHFTLTPQTQETTQGATQQGQILTPTGEASQQALGQESAEKARTDSEFTHSGYVIRQVKIRNGDAIESRWNLQSEENRLRTIKGMREIGGDSLHKTRESAIAEAERQSDVAIRDTEESKIRKSEEDARKAEEQARISVNRGLSITERKANATLAKDVKINGQQMSLRQAVEMLVKRGDKLTTEEEPKIKPMSRSEFNRADARQQQAHETRMKEAGNKTVYYIGGYDLGKTAYDYAQTLNSKQTQEANSKGASEPSSPYSAGEPNVSKTEGTNQRKLDKAANLRDMDASGALRHPESEGKFASQTQLVKENTRRIGAASVTTPEQAAQALSYLGRGAVERFDALVTDKNGKPLAIVGAFKGAISQASVYPSTLVGEAFRVPNAAAIWFAHNHPSGLAEFSQADRNIYSKLKDAFQGSRIEPKGMFAISGSEGEARNWVYAYDNAEDRKGTTASGLKGIGVPVMERVYTSTGKLWSAINSPSDAKSAIRHIAGDEPGIILLDAQHTPVAFVPWKPENTAPLRGNGNMDALYRAISVANSASAMIANPGNAYTINQINNLTGLFNSLDVKLLDVMEYGQDGSVTSMAEKGMPLDNNTFFSQSSNPVADPHTLSSLKAAINSTFHHVKDFAGLLEATGKFKLIVRDEIVKHLGEDSFFSSVQDHTDSIREKVKNAQEKPDIRYSSDGSRILAFVSKGEIFLVYDNISQTNDSVPGILKHEIGVHARRLGRTDPEFQKILKQVEVMHKTGNKAVVDAFNRVPADTAPENVTEESIGYLVEHAPNLSVSQKIIAWFRNAIRSMGNNLKGMDKLRWVQWANRLDEKDIVYMATQATRTAPETLASVNRDGMYKADRQQRFYSQLRKVIRDAPDKIFSTGAQVKLWLQANSSKNGIKADEIYWSGVNDYLGMIGKGRVSKLDVLAFLDGNGVKVETTILSDDAQIKWSAKKTSDGGYEVFANDQSVDTVYGHKNKESAISEVKNSPNLNDLIEDYGMNTGETKFGSYVVPGGHNYREMLLTLPKMAYDYAAATVESNRVAAEYESKVDALTKESGFFGAERSVLLDKIDALLAEKESALAEIRSRQPRDENFRSAHFDKPNILAHIRFDTRTDAEGRKIMFVQEIQSDWGQKGKREGFKPNDVSDADIEQMKKDGWHIEDVIINPAMPSDDPANHAFAAQKFLNNQWGPKEKTERAAWLALAKSKVNTITAPFVTDTKAWITLAMKHIISYAVDHGFDKVAFANGEQNAGHYDLSKQVKEIIYAKNDEGTDVMVDAIRSDGGELFHKKVTMKELPDIVGKEVAQKIADGGRTGKLSGLNLKVGGYGMNAFYNSIVPSVTNEVLKRAVGDKAEKMASDVIGASKDKYGKAYQDQTQQSFTITPDLRAKVQNEGLPLFSKSQSALSEEAGSIYDKIPSLPLVSKPIVGERFTLPGESQAQRFQRKMQNESNRWQVVQDAVVKQGGTVTPKTNVVDAILAYPGKVAAKYLKFGTDKIEPIMKRIAEANTTMDEVGLLAYAEHAHERNEAISEINPRFPNDGEQGKSGSGMTDKQAADIIAQAKSQPNAKELFALAQELRDINNARLDMLVSGGEMSQAQADAYRAKYKKYIQLKGFEEIDENGIPQGTGKGLSTGSKIDFRALGRSSMAGQILQNVFRDYEAAVMLSEKSEVAKVVANFIEANPDSKLWTVGQPESKPMITKGQSVHQVLNNGEVVAEFKTLAAAQGYAKALNDSGNKATIESHVITAETVTQRPSMFDENAEIRYIKDGKVVRIQINDPGLVRSYNRLWHPGVSEGLKFLNTYNSWLRQMYTQKNPAWFFMNALRDIPSAVIYSTGEAGAGMTLKIPANIPTAFKAAWNFHHNKSAGPVMDNIIKMYLDNGGYTGFSYVGDIEAQTIKLDGIIHKYTSWAQTAETFKRGEYRKGLGDILTKTMNTRMFAWIEALNTTFENMTRLAVFKSAIESGMTPQQAGLLAKHASTNFNQRGEWGPNMNAAWLFSNAGIQGTRNVGHALFFSPHKVQVWALMSGMIALGLMAGLVSDDDDDLVDDQSRQRALTFKIGDSQVSLPLPWGFGFFAGFGQYLAQFLKHPEKRDKIAVMMANLTMNHFFPFGNPLSGGEAKIGNLSNITPTAIRPFANAATNTSPFGGPLYPENQFDKTQPDSEKQWRRTKGSGYDATAKWLNELTGGDVAREGAISISPELLKLGVSTLFGGLGKLVSDSASLLVSDDIQSKNVPVVKNIYRSVDADSYLQRFYKDSEDAANAYKVYRTYLKAGKINEAREYLLEEHAYVTMGKTVTLYSKYMKALRDQEDQIKLSDISDSEKSLRIKALDAKRKMIAEKFNARLKSL